MCKSFRAHCADVSFEQLVLVLLPQAVSPTEAWVGWLHQLVQTGLSSQLRAIVLDDVGVPLLGDLASRCPRKVISTRANLDMAGAMQDLARAGGRVDSAADRYRMKYLALTRAVAASNWGEASRLCTEACAIARGLGWHHLVVPAKMAYGSALVAAGCPIDAFGVYREADEVAEQMERDGQAPASALRLQCHLSMGAALVSAQAFAHAAQWYEQAAPLAERSEAPDLLLECWRMAAYCHESVGNWKSAWECGTRALDVARNMDATARSRSTLAYVGEGLLRVSKRPPYDALASRIDLTMAQLVGNREWRLSAQQRKQPQNRDGDDALSSRNSSRVGAPPNDRN